MNPSNPKILLTFDVEDWFQVENLKQCIPYSSWAGCELRVEKNVNRLLDLLDSIKPNNPTNPIYPSNPINPSSPRATFFILGWIAERLPHLIRDIQSRGHEVASHGYGHLLCREQAADDLKKDLTESKKLLEDMTGAPVYGYRAPSFSIHEDMLKVVEDCGYLYDSSFNSFRLNRRYGQVKFSGHGTNSIPIQLSGQFYELPVSNLRIAKQAVPWGGGGYFRLIPLSVFRRGVESIIKKQGAYLFYLHPWEIDPGQPRVRGVARSSEFRHYLNLDKTYGKLSVLLQSLREYYFSTCHQSVKAMQNSR